ncbi:MAG: GHKL domain-containing protein [Clostridiales bacterium]|nr:GHKL domain-containing protein [Clostridiales bacterium]
MNTAQIVCYLIYNVFQTVIICKYANIFLKGGTKRKGLKAAAGIAYYAVNTFGFLVFSSYALNILTNILPMFVYSLLYDDRLYKRVFYVLSVYSMGMVLEDFLYIIFSFLFADFDLKIMVLFYVVFNLLFWGIYFVLKKIITNLSDADFRFKHLCPLLLVPICLIFFTQIFAASGFTINKFVIFGFMLGVSLLVFYCFYEIDKSYKSVYREYVLESQNRYYKNQLDIIKAADLRASKLRHDYKNHMLALKSYILSDNKAESLRYIDEISGSTDFEKQIVNSKNIVIDSLLNYKLRDYKEDNISLDLNISVPENLFVSAYDLNIILGNLTDNALTAVKKTEKREISISIKFINNSLFLRVGNTFDGILLTKENGLLTTKADKAGHGLGVDIIKETIKKYDGEIDIVSEENYFCNTVILHNKSALF